MNYKFKTKPYAHQMTALEKSWNRENYAYFMEMGTGKTKVTIDNIAYLYLQRKITSVLIIAPKSVYTNWESEIETHMPDVLKYKIYKWNIDKPKDYFKMDESPDLKIFLINVEALSTKRGYQACVEYLLKNKLNFVALDESTTIKNRSAKRTKNILSLAKVSHIKRILTGSPITKSPLDLFTQCAFLSPELLGFSSYLAFRNRYAEMKTLHMHGRQIQIVNGFKNLGELSNKLKEFSYRVLKEDCLDLPDKIFIKREIQLSPDQRRLYDQMKKEAIAILKGKQSTTVNTLTQLMRLQQITCGHFTADDGATQPIANNRITELMDVLEETEGKAIIWAHYQYDITAIIDAVSKKYGKESIVDYYGLTPQEERQPNIKSFQDDPKCRFIVGTPSTGGYGITLTAANTVIYYSNGYDLEKRLQSEDRAHRIGQKKSVTYVDIMADDTVDEKIVQALRKKINIASEVLGEELRSWI